MWAKGLGLICVRESSPRIRFITAFCVSKNSGIERGRRSRKYKLKLKLLCNSVLAGKVHTLVNALSTRCGSRCYGCKKLNKEIFFFQLYFQNVLLRLCFSCILEMTNPE